MQAHISVHFLHIFKGTWEGFHTSLHSLKKKMKGKWTVSRIVIYGLLHCKIKSLDTASRSLMPEFKFNLLRHVLVHVACLTMFIQSSCICNIWHSIRFLSFLLSFFLVLNNPDTFLASLQFSDFAPSNQRWINNQKEKHFWNSPVRSISRSCTINKSSKLRRMLNLNCNNRKWN